MEIYPPLMILMMYLALFSSCLRSIANSIFVIYFFGGLNYFSLVYRFVFSSSFYGLVSFFYFKNIGFLVSPTSRVDLKVERDSAPIPRLGFLLRGVCQVPQRLRSRQTTHGRSPFGKKILYYKYIY